MEKLIENILKAEKIIISTDNLINISSRVINDKRIYIKILNEIKNAISMCIVSILHYEYILNNIKLSKSPNKNFEIFLKKCARKYNIKNEEILLIKEIFEIIKKHKESPFEFLRNNKIIILSNKFQPKILSLEKIKIFLIVSKSILKKTKEGIKKKF